MLIRTALLVTAAAAILAGWFQLLRFSRTPGQQAAAPVMLAANVALPVGARQSPLLVFIHPQCSCTQATLQQLDRLLADLPETNRHFPTQLVLAVYSSAATGSRLPFVPAVWLHHPYRILADTNGQLARRFGAATSGEILLYSPARQLLFQGGITPERAQTGDGPGLESLRKALVSGQPTLRYQQSAVFGCPIFHFPIQTRVEQ